MPVPLSMLAGSATAALLAFLLSFPLFRMKGFYFLIGSFAAGEIIRLLWKWTDLTWLFGGPKGIKLIPPFPNIKLFSLDIDFYDPVNYYYLCLIVVVASLVVLYRVERSRIGLTFHAIHWQDKLAESVGVDTFRYRTLAFVISSFFAGLAGALYAHYIGTVAPEPVRRRGDGLCPDLGHRRRDRDLLWPDHRRRGADHSQRGGAACIRRRRDAADALWRDSDPVHPVPAERAGKPRAEDQGLVCRAQARSARGAEQPAE